MQARTQPWTEERLNAWSHGLGFLLALAAWPVLAGGARSLPGAGVFAATMLVLYGASAVYHALPQGRAKHWCNRLDHAAIFLFIAGTCTPFALGPGPSASGLLLGLVWSLALAGVVLKASNRLRHPLKSTAVYVALGWLALGAAAPLLGRFGAPVLLLVVGGGVAYLVGVVLFLLDQRLRYAHFVWHLFVLAGSGCHFFAALHHGLPS